jgi:hypothetical protein
MRAHFKWDGVGLLRRAVPLQVGRRPPLIAARHPLQNLRLIWFTVWSSAVHALVTAVHSFTDAGQTSGAMSRPCSSSRQCWRR